MFVFYADAPAPHQFWGSGVASNSVGYRALDPSDLPRTASINYVIDGGGSFPATGSAGQVNIPTNCTITGWVLTADRTGSAVVDVLRSTYGGFPVSLASIAGTDKPTISAAQKNENLGVTGAWTTALSAGDQVQFFLNSGATATRLNVTLNVTIP